MEWIDLELQRPIEGRYVWAANESNMRVSFMRDDGVFYELDDGRQLRFAPTHWQALPALPGSGKKTYYEDLEAY